MLAAEKAEFDRVEQGWTRLDEFPNLVDRARFVSGDQEGNRIRIRFYQNHDNGTYVGKVWFGPECAGPPNHAHGGSIAAVLDEAMGGAAWRAGYKVVAVRLEADFRKMVPLEKVIWFEAQVSGTERRKVFTSARLHLPGIGVFCEAKGIFVTIDTSRPELQPKGPATPSR